MVIISLLDLPLELPPDAPARQYGLETFTSGLPEYLSRCEKLYPHTMVNRADDGFLQARHSREECPAVLVRKRTEPMLFVLWRVFAFWTGLKRLSQGKMKINGHIYISPLGVLRIFQVYGCSPAFVLALRSSIRPRRRICGADQQISRWVLQSLGGRLLAIGPVCPGRYATSRCSEQGLWQSLQPGRFDAIYPELLSS